MLDDKIVAIKDQPSPDEDEVLPAHTSDSDDKSITDQVGNLVDDVRKLAEAELEYYRTKLSVNMAATKTVLLLFSVAIIVGATGLVALILGILLILSHYWGPVAATALLTGSALLVTTVLLNMAIKRARKLPLDENDP
ncbi:phage holin family protein [Parasphingorhabdus cellanae]|uniref:Phage holin family protein n=1 Tax=Parasphingorhabdus cellanae TaxID=2806553 RepID=A0ABX7T6N1_9SPHN|nr:phage holin family protein [Parasphingorhabdus cellanae]QTD56177.1 phage holin family protein [Parasphingorhabdus cellanae]